MMAKRSRPVVRRAGAAKSSRSGRRKPVPQESRATVEPVAAVAPEPLVAASDPPESEHLVQDSLPEGSFAARTPPPEPDRPWPVARRAIFFDVENTSRAAHVARLIDHLAVDHLGQRTDFVAAGNWRVIGHDTARLLARHGAQLVHAAPSVGVKDWSDLRIAVSAGVWLGTARPGDVLEIVSDDRAFDAVGDVAAGLGIAYRRLSYRSLSGAPEREPAEVSEPIAAAPDRQRRYGRHRGGRGRGPVAAVVARPTPAVPHRIEPPVQADTPAAEPHTAPHDEIVSIVRRLIEASPDGGTTLDALANGLKAHGFSRPPGSPRLITRLRRIKEIAVSRSGAITLSDSTAAETPSGEPEARSADHAGPITVDEPPAGGAGQGGETPSPGEMPRRRRSRRGGRGRRRRRPEAAATS